MGWFSDWFRRDVKTSDAPLVRSPRVSIPAEITARVARWCASEPPDRVALALETVQCLANASPQWLQPIPNAQPLAWLITAVERLERLPDPLPIPPPFPALAWRYLLLMRVLSDELETVYTTAWRHGWATRCPLADGPDAFLPARVLARGRNRDRLDSAGLAALVSGVRLPVAGLQLLYAAHYAGVDWSDSVAFWQTFNPINPPVTPMAHSAGRPLASNETPPALEAVSLPDAMPQRATPPLESLPIEVNAGSIPDATEAPTPAWVASFPVAALPVSPPNPPTYPVAEAAVTDPWSAVVRATLVTLITRPRFNQMAGDAWFYEGVFYVAAKGFAETLYQQPWVCAQVPGGDRKALYRHLAERQLVVTAGTQRIWSCYVSDNPAIHPRYVSTLKIASTVTAGLLPCPVFPGRLWPANRTDHSSLAASPV